MNSILIVLPILCILMFELGLNLKISDFMLIIKRPKSVFIGLFGQIVLLPLIAFFLCKIFGLQGIFLIGLMLISCCPGGSSSNVFSLLAKGDIALSVSLTALSSVITLFTLPLIMNSITEFAGESIGIHLPVKNLLIQNLLLMFLPIAIGIFVNYKFEKIAQKIEKVLSKLAFPLLMLLAGIFFIQNYKIIFENILLLGLCIFALLLLCIFGSYLLCKIFILNKKEQRTIIIEVGMQNAAQAIAIASSPFIFNNPAIATPSVIYALFMNIVLLTYVAFLKKK
ncbi:MAG: bile acid:sodium symporter family protein [Bacteroidales bacterium]|nr:bile acid:sodium symporter family protein [Bacteroidales bacterium]